MLLGRHRNTSLLKSPWQCGFVSPGDKGSIAYLFSLAIVPRDGRKIDPPERKRPLHLRKVSYVLLYEVVDFVNYTFIDVLSYRGRVPDRVVDMGGA